MKVEHHCRGRWPRAASGRGSRLPPRGPVRRPSPHAAPSPGPAVPDSTRSVLPPKRKRVARTCQATGGRLLVHRPPSGRGPGASAAPAVPAPRAHRAHRTGMWSPAPRKPPWGFLLLEKQRWAEPSAGGSVAVLAGAGGGTEGEGLLPSVVFKFRGRGWNALQASLPRPGARGGGALLLGRPPLPTWQRPTRSAGRITPGSRKSRVAVGVDTGNRTSLSQHSSTSSDGKNDSTESRNNVPCVIPNTTQPRIRGEFASHAATPSSVVRAF